MVVFSPALRPSSKREIPLQTGLSFAPSYTTFLDANLLLEPHLEAGQVHRDHFAAGLGGLLR